MRETGSDGVDDGLEDVLRPSTEGLSEALIAAPRHVNFDSYKIER